MQTRTGRVVGGPRAMRWLGGRHCEQMAGRKTEMQETDGVGWAERVAKPCGRSLACALACSGLVPAHLVSSEPLFPLSPPHATDAHCHVHSRGATALPTACPNQGRLSHSPQPQYLACNMPNLSARITARGQAIRLRLGILAAIEDQPRQAAPICKPSRPPPFPPALRIRCQPFMRSVGPVRCFTGSPLLWACYLTFPSRLLGAHGPHLIPIACCSFFIVYLLPRLLLPALLARSCVTPQPRFTPTHVLSRP